MLSMSQIADELALCQKKRQALQTLRDVTTEWETLLSEQEQALRTLQKVQQEEHEHVQQLHEVQLTLPDMRLPEQVDIPHARRRDGSRKGRTKTDTQVIEEIFRQHGPLHVTDIVRLGVASGVSFKGSKKPTLMARDKMYGSQRFHNFGGNVWGLPWQELPERSKRNGRNQESPQSTHVA